MGRVSSVGGAGMWEVLVCGEGVWCGEGVSVGRGWNMWGGAGAQGGCVVWRGHSSFARQSLPISSLSLYIRSYCVFFAIAQ